jgi:hypothetical protein
MKGIVITGIATIFVLSAHAQSNNAAVPKLPLLENKIVYLDTVWLDSSYRRSQLFENAEQWYHLNYETADNILTTDNSRDGEINGTGIIHDSPREKQIGAGDVFFTIDIIALRGAYVYRVYDIAWIENETKNYFSDMYYEELHPQPKSQWTAKYRRDMLTNMAQKTTAMLAKLKESMKMKSK